MASVTHKERSPDELAANAGGIPARLSWRTAPGWFVGRPAWVQVLVWFVVIVLVKHANLLEPPVWDSAMGVFPPAIYLYENNFDIVGLLQESGWAEGGPNVHSLSLLTWFIAVVMTVTHSPTATFLIVHLVTFVVFAWALMLFTRVLRSCGLAPRTVLAAACFLLLIPMVLVQVGSIYTETLVLCTSVAAWTFWREGRPGFAVLVCVLGIFLKLTGVAMAALIGAALLFSGRPYTLRKIALILTLPLALYLNLALPGWLGAKPLPPLDWGETEQLLFKFRARMEGIPDVQWLIRLGLLSSGAYLITRLWRERNAGVLMRTDPDSRSRLLCLAMPFVFMGGVLAMIHANYLFLNRYLLPVLPFAIGSALLFAREVRGELIAFVVLIGACIFSLANHKGRYYRPAHASFSIVERSHAYRDFHAVQIEAIDVLARKPAELPAYVSREVDYMISHPMMGYVEEPIPNTFPIYRAPHRDLTLAELPADCLLLRTNNGHGGSEMQSLVREARASSDHEVTEEVIERNGFRTSVYRIKRTDS